PLTPALTPVEWRSGRNVVTVPAVATVTPGQGAVTMSDFNSTTPAPSDKPAKPRPDFPLFPHATGRWAKKIRGKLHYFGPWADPDGALAKYQEQADALHAGRTPRPDPEALTVYDLGKAFLAAKKEALDAGELSPRTWADYGSIMAKMAKG